MSTNVNECFVRIDFSYKNQLEQFKNLLIDDSGEINFRKLIPVPEVLQTAFEAQNDPDSSGFMVFQSDILCPFETKDKSLNNARRLTKNRLACIQPDLSDNDFKSQVSARLKKSFAQPKSISGFTHKDPLVLEGYVMLLRNIA